MGKIEVSRYVNDQGVEVYASPCGQYVGMSQRALARMTKTGESLLRTYFKKNGCTPMTAGVLAAQRGGAKQPAGWPTHGPHTNLPRGCYG